MFSPMVRAILVAVCTVAAATEFYRGEQLWFLLLLAALGLAYEHFRGGSIFLAFHACRNQNIEKVRRYIGATTRPEWLRPSSRAYYEFLKGSVSVVDKDFEAARAHFRRASEGPLRTENMKSVACYNLASVLLKLGEVAEAKSYLGQARAIPHRDEMGPILEDLGSRIDEAAEQAE